MTRFVMTHNEKAAISLAVRDGEWSANPFSQLKWAIEGAKMYVVTVHQMTKEEMGQYWCRKCGKTLAEHRYNQAGRSANCSREAK